MRAEGPPEPGLRSPEMRRFLARLRAAPASLLILDYDGTLSPFCEDPAQARPYPEALPLLGALAASPRARLAVVTGRSLASIAALLSLSPMPEVWASHGRERRGPDGEVHRVPPSTAQGQGLRDARRVLASAAPAGRVEEKPFSLAFHVRGLPPREGERSLGAVRSLWREIAGEAGLEILPFDGGLELRAPGWTKGDAVRALLAGAPPGAAAAYLGDDATDEDAFEALSALGGLPVLVRREGRPTRARAWLRPPEELVAFLERWRDAVAQGGGDAGGAPPPA